MIRSVRGVSSSSGRSSVGGCSTRRRDEYARVDGEARPRKASQCPGTTSRTTSRVRSDLDTATLNYRWMACPAATTRTCRLSSRRSARAALNWLTPRSTWWRGLRFVIDPAGHSSRFGKVKMELENSDGEVPPRSDVFSGWLRTPGDLHQCATVVRNLFGPTARLSLLPDGSWEISEAQGGKVVGLVRFTDHSWAVSVRLGWQ